MDTFRCKKVALVVGIGLVVLSGCNTAPPGGVKAGPTAVETKAAAEIQRICALPTGEREAELKKIKDESGMVIYCGDQ
jgi:hypothetical protein